MLIPTNIGFQSFQYWFLLKSYFKIVVKQFSISLKKFGGKKPLKIVELNTSEEINDE